MKHIILLAIFIFPIIEMNAQIGYQVSLLNSATGEPRANETVNVTIDITNSENTSIYQGTQTATTNDFGVLSLQVGNATTFESVDWSKLPLFVSATVDGVMVGRSQILNVPIAEAAKTLVNVSLDSICKVWTGGYGNGTDLKLELNRDLNFTFYKWMQIRVGDSYQYVWQLICSGHFFIEGHNIYLFSDNHSFVRLVPNIIYHTGKLLWLYDSYYCILQ